MKTILCLTTFFLMTGVLTCVAQSDAPSLAEIARQNQSTRKAMKVFNDDNTQRTAPSVEARATVPAATATELKKNTSSPASKDSAKVAELQKALDSLKQNQAGWSKSAKDYETKLANETSDFRRQIYLEALENDKKNVESYQSQINDAQAALKKAQSAAASSQSASGKTQETARAY
jgi:hypothetical protein